MGTGPSSMPPYTGQITCDMSNDTHISACFGRGECIRNNILNYSICQCDKFDSYTFCEKSVYELYVGKGLWVFYSSIIIYTILFILFVLELTVDLFRNKGTKSAPFIAKIILTIHCLLHIIDLGIHAHEAKTNNFGSKSWQLGISLFHLLSTSIFVGIAYMVVCVAWLDLLLRARNFGIVDNSIRNIKLSTIIICSIIYPATLIFRTCEEIIESRSIVQIFNFAATLGTFISLYYCMILITVLVIKVFVWIKNMNQHDSKTIKRVKYRGKIILIFNAINISLSFVALGFITINGALAPILIIRLILNEVIVIIEVFLLFLFLENYLFGYKFGTGYILGLRGELKRKTTIVISKIDKKTPISNVIAEATNN